MRDEPTPLATALGTDAPRHYLIAVFDDPASFREVFCADLPAEQAAIPATVQRPAAATAFGNPTHAPAWKTLPSWAVVATADKAIGVTGSRLTARRAGATVVEVGASHVLILSQPRVAAEVILTALDSVA